ncbi:MAG: glycosyltransferase family A protein [Pseudomonadota bacterium]
MTDPRVSVIVPAFNAGRWLKPCIESILAQTVSDFEVIVVDDGSTDGSVDTLVVSDQRLRIVKQNNQGAAAARNRGFAETRGRWISFVDADDLLHRDKLRHQFDYLSASPSLELTAGSWCRFVDQPPAVPQVVADDLWRPQTPVSWQIAALSQNLMIQPAAWLASRSLVERVGPWNPALSLNDDGEYFARLMLATDQVGFSARALSFYRSGSDQTLSAGRSASHFKSAVTALELIGRQLLTVEDSDAVRSALAAAWSRLAVECYPYAPDLSLSCEVSARDHGHFQPAVGGGRWVRRLAGPLGWRLARRLQATVYDLGYRQFGQRRTARKAPHA